MTYRDSMNYYVALIRGITPSGPGKTSNEQLLGVFERLGFTKTRSILASGNIVFASEETNVATLERTIESALQEDLEIPGLTIVRSLPELRALLDTNPFPNLTHERGTYLAATFFKAQLPPEMSLEADDNLTKIVGYDADARALLAITDNSMPGTTPAFMARLEKISGKQVTTRTWLTIQRIVKKLEALSN